MLWAPRSWFILKRSSSDAFPGRRLASAVLAAAARAPSWDAIALRIVNSPEKRCFLALRHAAGRLEPLGWHLQAPLPSPAARDILNNVSFVSLQENLRKELRRRIRRGGMTGTDLARRTGFTQAHVSNFLNGKRGLKLGALDRVLKAAGLTVHDLLDPRLLGRNAASPEHRADYVDVPLVDAKVAATANRIGQNEARQQMRVSRAFLDRLRASPATPARKSWTRFVAVEVDAKEAAAMAPLLLPHARLLLDRHYNSLDPYRKGEPNLYAVRKASGLAVRYLDFAEKNLVLRPRHQEASVELMPVPSGNYSEMIVGRVAQIRLET